MNALESLLRQVSAFFRQQGRSWALVGGLAVSVRTEPRFTRDLDTADLRQLISVCPESDFALVEEAVRLIELRGFNRSRDLAGALNKAWSEFRPE